MKIKGLFIFLLLFCASAGISYFSFQRLENRGGKVKNIREFFEKANRGKMANVCAAVVVILTTIAGYKMDYKPFIGVCSGIIFGVVVFLATRSGKIDSCK